VLRRASLSVSDPKSGEASCSADVLISSAFEDVVEIVRFLCRPLSADTDIVDGREKVTLVVRVDSPSFRERGCGPPSSLEIAVVVVGTAGNIGFVPRIVCMEATEGLRRLGLSVALLLLRLIIDSDGRLGKGGGTDIGGSVLARVKDALSWRKHGVGEGS